jgi:hypothetical protein
MATIAAKKKEQFHAQYLLENAAEEPLQDDLELFKRLIARDVNAASMIPCTLRTADYRTLLVVMPLAGVDRWLREQDLGLTLCFQGPSHTGAPSLLSFIQVTFYDCREWTTSNALRVQQ